MTGPAWMPLGCTTSHRILEPLCVSWVLSSSPGFLSYFFSAFSMMFKSWNSKAENTQIFFYIYLFMLYVLQGGVSTCLSTPVPVQRITFATWVLRFKLKSSVLVAGACTHWGLSQAPDVIFKWADARDDFLSQNVWVSGNIIMSQHLPDCIYRGWIICAILSCWFSFGGKRKRIKDQNGLGYGAVNNATECTG